MKNSYRLKVLAMVILLPALVYYLLTNPLSSVTGSSGFILFYTGIAIYQEWMQSFKSSAERTRKEMIIDRFLIFLLLIVSLDVFLAFIIH